METLNQEAATYLKERCISRPPCHPLHARRIIPEAIDHLFPIVFRLRGLASIPANSFLCGLLKNERIEWGYV